MRRIIEIPDYTLACITAGSTPYKHVDIALACIKESIHVPEDAGDLISRKAVEEELRRYATNEDVDYSRVSAYVESIETAVPEIKPHWIERRLSMGIHDWTCSVCKCQYEEPIKICPNCGANTEGRYVLDERSED